MWLSEYNYHSGMLWHRKKYGENGDVDLAKCRAAAGRMEWFLYVIHHILSAACSFPEKIHLACERTVYMNGMRIAGIYMHEFTFQSLVVALAWACKIRGRVGDIGRFASGLHLCIFVKRSYDGMQIVRRGVDIKQVKSFFAV